MEPGENDHPESTWFAGSEPHGDSDSPSWRQEYTLRTSCLLNPRFCCFPALLQERETEPSSLAIQFPVICILHKGCYDDRHDGPCCGASPSPREHRAQRCPSAPGQESSREEHTPTTPWNILQQHDHNYGDSMGNGS